MSVEVAYWAGIIDGEGAIEINHRQPRPKHRQYHSAYTLRLILFNTYEPLLRDFQTFTGFTGCWQTDKRYGNSHDCYRVYLCAHQALNVITRCYPYLKVKRKMAKLAISFMSCVTPSRGSHRITDAEIQLRQEFWRLSRRTNSRARGKVALPEKELVQ